MPLSPCSLVFVVGPLPSHPSQNPPSSCVPTAASTALIRAMTQVVQVSVLSGGKIPDSNTGSVRLLLDGYGQVTSPLCFFFFFFIYEMTATASNSQGSLGD